MITYVNTVLVANNATGLVEKSDMEGLSSVSGAKALAGKLAFMNLGEVEDDADIYTPAVCKKFKVGVATGDYITKVINGATKYIPVIKWSNDINTADIKNVSVLEYPEDDKERTEETVIIDFSEKFPTDLATRGGFPIILRLSFKDLPTRYRQWSESYDYYVNPEDSSSIVAGAFAEIINKQTKRARVSASATGSVLTIEALPYDDNESADSENFNAKVRFNANVWYSDPLLPGFASNNKYGLGKITKLEGWEYAASAKNVRDRERTAQGYQGILNRSEWYDIKPAMAVKMDGKYSAITIEFENMYRAADDIFRKTKQTVEIYGTDDGASLDPASFGDGDLGDILISLESARSTHSDNTTSYADDPDAVTETVEGNGGS